MFYEDRKLDSEETILNEIQMMNSFGCRTTGALGHREFIEWLKQKLNYMGLNVHQDLYKFDRWEERRSALYINQEEIHVSSAYPYSGETGDNGVTGKLIYVKNGDYKKAKGNIAVVEIKAIKKLPIGLVMNKRKGFPGDHGIVSGDGDLVLTSVLRNPNLKKAKKMGVKAVV